MIPNLQPPRPNLDESFTYLPARTLISPAALQSPKCPTRVLSHPIELDFHLQVHLLPLGQETLPSPILKQHLAKPMPRTSYNAVFQHPSTRVNKREVLLLKTSFHSTIASHSLLSRKAYMVFSYKPPPPHNPNRLTTTSDSTTDAAIAKAAIK